MSLSAYTRLPRKVKAGYGCDIRNEDNVVDFPTSMTYFPVDGRIGKLSRIILSVNARAD
jgi:hypothetical protein